MTTTGGFAKSGTNTTSNTTLGVLGTLGWFQRIELHFRHRDSFQTSDTDTR